MANSARFLPMMAEALNDIYSKMEETNSKLGHLEKIFQEFLASLGQKNMIIIQNLKKLQGVISDLNNEDKLQKSIRSIRDSVGAVQDGIWFLEFQTALTRLKEKLDESL